ncbi:serine hydrolase domain-containing protein [Sphingomonas sp.]|uniref:serine hydrolase domain-containing protein n=1 Tax=Sphingomonas sp. TaxID=28214 RepID=UPI00325FB9AF
MERQHIIGFGVFAALVGAVALAAPHHRVDANRAGQQKLAAAHLKLARLSMSARHDINYAQLDARLKYMVARPTMVGLSVGVIENGRITFLAGYGETTEGSGDAVTPETVFRWASCSKGLAATMVAKLAEQGKVDLNAPVANYSTSLRLPNGGEYRATVTDLLSHRLGLYRNAYDNKLEEGESPFVLRSTLGQLNAVCAPGTCWDYQNVAYDASSEMVARVMGMPYPQAVKRTLFDPIGMTSASATRDGLMGARNWARPHSVGRRVLPVTDAYYKVPAAGGINSNIKDFALWMIAQSGGMPDVLSPKLLATIHAPLVKTPGEAGRMRKFAERVHSPFYGMGWRSYDYAGHHIVGHRGGVNGYRSLILFDPALKSGVVALWNSNTSQPGGLEFEVMDMIYHLPFRDWMELSKSGPPVPSADDGDDQVTPAVAARGSSASAG